MVIIAQHTRVSKHHMASLQYVLFLLINDTSTRLLKKITEFFFQFLSIASVLFRDITGPSPSPWAEAGMPCSNHTVQWRKKWRRAELN